MMDVVVDALIIVGIVAGMFVATFIDCGKVNLCGCGCGCVVGFCRCVVDLAVDILDDMCVLISLYVLVFGCG